MLPDDLKIYRAENGFVLFTEGEALVCLAIILAACLILDLLARLA